MNYIPNYSLFPAGCKTKYFGDITFYAESVYCFADVKYNDNNFWIGLEDQIIFEENKLKICLSIIDKYLEIIQIVKDTIKKEWNNIEILDINHLEKIEAIINKIYPCLLFSVGWEDDKIYFSLGYFPSEEKPFEPYFSVEMDQELYIKRLGYEGCGV